MTQDGSMQNRVERVAQSLAPQFDAVRLKLARAIAAAEDGRLIEQTERIIFAELNRLKTTTQEVGLQERVDEAEAVFSPSGASAEAWQRDDPSDAQRAGVASGASLAAGGGRQ